MNHEYKKRFIKYRLIPLFIFSMAIALTLLFVSTVMTAKVIPVNVGIVMIFTLIFMWAVALDSNQDAHAKEIKDMIRDRLPKPNDKITERSAK